MEVTAQTSKVPALVSIVQVNIQKSKKDHFKKKKSGLNNLFSLGVGAMSDPPSGDISFYMILVGIGALVTVCGCAACAFILSHQHRKRKKQQAIPPEEGINNQREFVNLIRNVDRPVPSLSPATTLMQPTTPVPVSRCYEEIELTLPPSPAPSHPSPALKPVHAPKLDISNRDREKLNRFHYTDNQELEV